MVIIMFSGYKISNNILYLYVDYRFEIGNIFSNDKADDIITNVKRYIKEHKLKFNGTKVILLLSGLMLGTVYLNNIKMDNYDIYPSNKYVYNIVDKSIPLIENKKEVLHNSNLIETTDSIKQETIYKNDVITSSSSNLNNNTSNVLENEKGQSNTGLNQPNNNQNISNMQNNVVGENKIITLKRTNGQIVQMDIEEYLVGIVAAEMPASFNEEALKAQAIVARTYTLKLLEQKRTLTDDVSTQVYKSNEELKEMWQGSYNTYYNKVRNAVNNTKGKVIKYNGELIDAVYHSTSNGYTEDSVNVWGNTIPYLKSVTSPWDTSASTFLREENKTFDEISSRLGIDFNSNSIIQIILRDVSNRILKIKINDTLYTGVQLRTLLGLRSADFDVSLKDGFATFTTRGYGHGVGMSQYGANGMANSGYNYEQILRYYYNGIEIIKI